MYVYIRAALTGRSTHELTTISTYELLSSWALVYVNTYSLLSPLKCACTEEYISIFTYCFL